MPEVTFDWEVSDRAVSEIGGRLIEDFVLRRIPHIAETLQDRHSRSLAVTVPITGRTIEDFRFVTTHDSFNVELLVDVKGHNQQRRGSRPNLASIRKCIEFYSDPQLVHQEIVIFFCRYEPRVQRGNNRTQLIYEVLPRSFDEQHVIPLRWLGRANLDPGNIGSGGLILLARESNLITERRSREEFVILLQTLEQHLRERSANPTLNTDARGRAARAG